MRLWTPALSTSKGDVWRRCHEASAAAAACIRPRRQTGVEAPIIKRVGGEGIKEGQKGIVVGIRASREA